ncbi:MAG: LPS export ABC transporter periplasmic protein LptC [Fibrobacteres bacterium]|nr:LPS export ABC transporter periplasmic protein LptC [Fibrobacterota bacterium]
MPWIKDGLVLAACSHIEEAPTAKGPKKELPLAEYKDTTILSMYEGAHLSWILKTKYLVKWPRTDLVRAKPVDLVLYDSLGKSLMHVTSDSGSVDEAVSFLAASGHVHGHSEKGVDIQSDSLRWNKAINQISTEAKVRVVSEEGDVLTGKGFVSDAKLDNWQILSDVKGVFQKVEERFQNADSTGNPPADSAKRAAPSDTAHKGGPATGATPIGTGLPASATGTPTQGASTSPSPTLAPAPSPAPTSVPAPSAPSPSPGNDHPKAPK